MILVYTQKHCWLAVRSPPCQSGASSHSLRQQQVQPQTASIYRHIPYDYGGDNLCGAPQNLVVMVHYAISLGPKLLPVSS